MGRTKSYKSLSGNRITHFDENGNKIGVSYKSASGKRITHFDANGNKTGTSWGNDHGRYRHYDSTGAKTGTSYVKPSGMIRHFDEKTGKSSTSYQNFMGGYVTPTDAARNSGQRPVRSSSSNSEADSASGCAWMILFYIAVFIITCIRISD